MTANPILAEVTRGAMVESRHRGAIAVIKVDGQIVAAIGNTERLIYPRSAIKPLQALALVESGAAKAFGLGVVELALACASHNSEPQHIEALRTWLGRVGLTECQFECGAHLPRRTTDRDELAKTGSKPRPIHNNCSGKHAGFMTTALHCGKPVKGYTRHEHLVQQRAMDIVSELGGVSLLDAPAGIDGCGIPVAGMPLKSVALAFARFANGKGLAKQRRAATLAIYQAMVEQPFMVAGTGRWCTRAIKSGGGAFIVKTGAEGVYCGAVPAAGIGIAIKVDDGAQRAAECAMGWALARFAGLDGPCRAEISDLAVSPVNNFAGQRVGEVHPSAELATLGNGSF